MDELRDKVVEGFRRAHPSVKIDLHGMRFGRLRVLTWVPSFKQGAQWLCDCDCGSRAIVSSHSLRNRLALSCGCLQKEGTGIPHGDPRTKLRAVWRSMINRCTNRAGASYRNYGGRGIRVCDEWRKNHLAFVEWAMGQNYRFGLELDRINVDGNYEPDNCRFVTRLENRRNRRVTRWMSVSGERITRGEAAERFGIPYDLIKNRLRRGWTDEEAVSTTRVGRGFKKNGDACCPTGGRGWKP